MSKGFWAFECQFVINNNLLMAEVFVGATRKELISAMTAFFRVPRAKVLLADVLGAWYVGDGAPAAFHDATPFLRIAIAKQDLPFDDESRGRIVGDLEGGGLSRVYLSRGRAMAEDAKESDEEDDEDPELKPFELRFDAEGFLASLPAIDGDKLPKGGTVKVVRPTGAPGYPPSEDDGYYHADVELGPGWWDATPGSRPSPFTPRSRFVRDREVPMV